MVRLGTAGASASSSSSSCFMYSPSCSRGLLPLRQNLCRFDIISNLLLSTMSENKSLGIG
ncbi:hypothetical protein AALP_AA5G041000 [Arabis alpina]|uniref:Uncharacterized protein n=1 Tax=Arabis alpina TaxID=50452 RepID=A0A087GUU3_ARAAL|nr:hypothetical protein AALP_AA5G041000 [Arabis alpina]